MSTDSLATSTITTLGGEMFTEASDATVIYPITPYFGFDLGYDKKIISSLAGFSIQQRSTPAILQGWSGKHHMTER